MSWGLNLLSWRRHRKVSQTALAQKAGLSRPYLSRLERDEGDPSLSTLRRLAVSLEITLSELLESLPPPVPLSREKMDLLARGALRPHEAKGVDLPHLRSFSRLLRDKRVSLGLFRARRKKGGVKPRISSAGVTLRRLRAELGELQWQALLKRVEKHASYLGISKE